MSDATDAWLSEAPDDPQGSRTAARFIVRVFLGVGVGLLWMIGLGILFINTFGDCFDTEAACDAVWVLATQRAQAMLAVVAILTIAAALAFIKVGPRTLGILFVLSLAIGGLAFAGAQAEPYTIPYFPAALEMIAPALGLFIIAAIIGIALGRQPVK